MSIIYNGIEIEKVIYNNSELDSISYNEVEVFSSTPAPFTVTASKGYGSTVTVPKTGKYKWSFKHTYNHPSGHTAVSYLYKNNSKVLTPINYYCPDNDSGTDTKKWYY